MARTTGLVLSVLLLIVSGWLGLSNGLRELSDTFTPFQRTVSTGVLIYGILGIAGAIALIARWRSAVWFTTAWAVVVTFVASTAAHAYAGEDATLVGAIAGGLGTALIGFGVVWCARSVTRSARSRHVHTSSAS